MTQHHMPPAFVHRFRIYANTKQHQWRVNQARLFVTDWFGKCKRPYISFSGGKDSLAALHLVREQDPSCPAVYWDADCAFPEVEDLIKQTPHCTKYPCAEPFLDTLARFGLHAGQDLENETMKTTVYTPVSAYIAETGVDGAAYGLRMAESRGRRMNGLTKGAVFFAKGYGVTMCQPVFQWSYDDVWAYIVSKNVPYCGTYDRMWDMPEKEQRISYWAGESNRQNGRWVWLKRNYPDLFNRFAARFPEARAYV